MKYTIWRGLFLDSLSDLDLNNFGNHWTLDQGYPYSIEFMYNNISTNKRIGEKLFLFKTHVDSNNIDFDSSIASNDEYPSESEIILFPNTVLEEVILINREPYVKYNTINSGNSKKNI